MRTTAPSAAFDSTTYVVRVWKSSGFIAALRRVDAETTLLFDDPAALLRHLEAEARLPMENAPAPQPDEKTHP
jgi:hypothetical protein